MIELFDIQKTYKGRTVLEIPAFTFQAGKKYVLLGGNGSGKTTLLRILAGTLLPNRGEVRFGWEKKTGDIAYMPQKPYAFSYSVLKNVTLALPPGADQETARRALRQVGMEDFLLQKGNRLSGGETQRVAFARIIVAPHKVLLLDEPTSATDILGNDLVEAALNDYLSAQGCTMIFATHSLPQALRLADTALFMENGRIVEWGPAEQVLLHPRTTEAQRFLGFFTLPGSK